MPKGRGAEEWLDAAYGQLVGSGVDAVKILPLAKSLNTARTSFYWFFKDRDALLEALVQRWKAKNTHGLIRQTELYAASIVEATLNVFDCWLDASLFDSEFEFAMRNWGLQSSAVGQELAAADDSRIAALTAMFVRFGATEQTANVRARTMYLTQIGYISTKTRETKEQRISRVADYVHIFTGQPCGYRDLERFASRHTSRLSEWMKVYVADGSSTRQELSR